MSNIGDISDLRFSIITNSDQLNADDLLVSPLQLTITEVRLMDDAQQPVQIFYGDERSYRPCKTMRRLLLAVFGPDGRRWVGKSIVVYRDPSIMHLGRQVGGIRISHMSDLVEPFTLSLTVRRGVKIQYTVQPLPTAQ